MTRRLLAGLGLLTTLTAALALGLASVPHAFKVGSTMSAGGMNANLDAVSDRVEAVSDSLNASRLVQLNLAERLAAAWPTSRSAASSDPEAFLSPQQARPRVAPGSVADPSVVNGFFSGYAAAMSDADELTHVVLEELGTLSEGITAAELVLGLPVDERADAVVAPYTAPELIEFRRNARTVPGEMNDNFTAVAAALEPLEQNAAEVSSWVAHERARLEAIEAATGGGPGGPDDVFRAAVGYRHAGEDHVVVYVMLVLFSYEPESPGERVSVTMTGPPGWNEGKPASLGTHGRGQHEAYLLVEVLSGDYTITATVGGKEYTATSTVDASLRMPDVTGHDVAVDEEGIHLSWNPVAGAVSYQVWYFDHSNEDGLPRFDLRTRDTSATIPIPRSQIDMYLLNTYSIDHIAKNYAENAAGFDYGTQPIETINHEFRIDPRTVFD